MTVLRLNSNTISYRPGTIDLRSIILRSVTLIEYHLTKSLPTRASLRSVDEWCCLSCRTLVYVLALCQWLAEPQYCAPNAPLKAAHVLLHETWNSDSLTSTLKTLFVIHSRQYAFATQTIDTTAVCTTFEGRQPEAYSFFTLKLLNADDVMVRRCARHTLIKAMPLVSPILTVTLYGVTVCIASAQLSLVAIITVAETNSILWKIEMSRQCFSHDFWLLDMLQKYNGTETSLKNLLYLVAQLMRIWALNAFYAAATELMRMCSGTISSALFKNAVFLRAWPKVNLEQSWSLEIAINIGVGHCTAISATATRVLPFSYISRGSSKVQELRCGMVLATHSSITPLSVLDAATVLALSRSISCVLNEAHFSEIKDPSARNERI